MSRPATLQSIKPYLLRAWHAWCTDQGLTPYLLVQVGAGVDVPKDYVQDDRIVLNISQTAINGLNMGNEIISFSARFGGRARSISVPCSHVLSIFAKETGEGAGFEPPGPDVQASGLTAPASATPGQTDAAAPGPEAARPKLTRIK